MSKITYPNKERLKEDAFVNEINKITAIDMNQIKSAVNNNDTRIGIIEDNLNSGIAMCKMSVIGAPLVTADALVLIDEWEAKISRNGFLADVQNSRLFIPIGTTFIQTSGMICGGGSAHCVVEIIATDGSFPINDNLQERGILMHRVGNDYWKLALPAAITQLDPNKAYYIYLLCSGYNGDSFTLNEGFGSSSYIQAIKLL